MSEQLQADRLVQAYVKMRDKRAELSAAFEAEDNKISAQMELVEAELLKICKSIGADSVRTPFGNVYLTV